jgi:hypothetical protein
MKHKFLQRSMLNCIIITCRQKPVGCFHSEPFICHPQPLPTALPVYRSEKSNHLTEISIKLLFPLKKRTSTRHLPPPNIIHPSAQGANLRILLSRNTKKTRESLLQGLTPYPIVIPEACPLPITNLFRIDELNHLVSDTNRQISRHQLEPILFIS